MTEQQQQQAKQQNSDLQGREEREGEVTRGGRQLLQWWKGSLPGLWLWTHECVRWYAFYQMHTLYQILSNVNQQSTKWTDANNTSVQLMTNTHIWQCNPFTQSPGSSSSCYWAPGTPWAVDSKSRRGCICLCAVLSAQRGRRKAVTAHLHRVIWPSPGCQGRATGGNTKSGI